jgi:hypothetical protein
MTTTGACMVGRLRLLGDWQLAGVGSVGAVFRPWNSKLSEIEAVQKRIAYTMLCHGVRDWYRVLDISYLRNYLVLAAH